MTNVLIVENVRDYSETTELTTAACYQISNIKIDIKVILLRLLHPHAQTWLDSNPFVYLFH